MSVEIRYFEGDENAQTSKSLESFANLDNTVSDWANTDYIQNGAPDIPYATLESGIWKLDGTRKLLSDDDRFFLCGEVDKVLEFTISFSSNLSPILLSLFFSASTDQWPASAELVIVRGDGYINEPFEIPINKAELHFRYYDWTLDEVNNFCEAIIVRLHPKSGQRVKVRKIVSCISTILGKKELSKVRMTTEFDPSLASLPTDVLSFDVRVPSSNEFLLREGNRVKLYKNGTLEHTMWINEIGRVSQNQYSVNCQSLIGTLNQKYYGKIMSPGGVIDGYGRHGNAWSYVNTLVQQIAQYGDRFSVNYTSLEAQNYCGNEVLIGYLPVCEEKEALRQIQFAAGLVVSTVHGCLDLAMFRDPSDKFTTSFKLQDIIRFGSIRKLDPVGTITVNWIYENYIYQEWQIEDHDVEIFEVPRIVHIIPEPQWDEIEDGGMDYGYGWGKGLLPNRNMDHYIEFVKVPETRKITYIKNGKNLVIDDCSLIHNSALYEAFWPGDPYGMEMKCSGVLENVFDRLSTFVDHRIVLEQEVIVTDQHAGDYIRTLTPWGTTVEGWIISMDSTLTQNGHRARIKVLGKEVS